jgi:hypothetical protein
MPDATPLLAFDSQTLSLSERTPDAILRAMEDPNRTAVLRAFEGEAEVLVVYQLDLLAQLEAQLRAVQHTMRCIEKLRATNNRVGPELTNAGRGETLKILA